MNKIELEHSFYIDLCNGEIMNEQQQIVKPCEAHSLGCDCRNCVSYQLDLMEVLRVEFDFNG